MCLVDWGARDGGSPSSGPFWSLSSRDASFYSMLGGMVRVDCDWHHTTLSKHSPVPRRVGKMDCDRSWSELYRHELGG